jgi:hypothetical protein
VNDLQSDPPGASSEGGARHSAAAADIGWIRAIGSGALIVAVGFVGAVWLPNLIVVHLDGLTTFTRSILAASLVVIVVVAIAWGLRRLQARRLI